jgi:hypothetical protein
MDYKWDHLPLEFLILLKLKRKKSTLKVKLEALMANAGTLFSKDPVIELVDISS